MNSLIASLILAVSSESYSELFTQIGIIAAGVASFVSAFHSFMASQNSRNASDGVKRNSEAADKLAIKVDEFAARTEGRESMMLALEKSLPTIRHEMERMADERISTVKDEAQKRIDELQAELDLWRTGQNKL